jgi:hypothetical protein
MFDNQSADKNALAHVAPVAAAARTGSTMRNVEPRPTLHSTQMRLNFCRAQKTTDLAEGIGPLRTII